MGLGFKIKHHFFNAFREVFVHHHGSLAFRAKVFALVIAANDNLKEENYAHVKDEGLIIYKNDENRANLLMLSTKELVTKVKDDNGLYLDTLVTNIQKELKIIPRYAHKINLEELRPLLHLANNRDTVSYQENILEFLQDLKDETLNNRQVKSRS